MREPVRYKVQSRYSIGEWHGVGLGSMSASERVRRAKAEIDTEETSGQPCPFQAGPSCNKKGGVCSLRLYQRSKDGTVSGTGPLVTTCPNRFLESGTIFRWIGETLLGNSGALVLGEVGFLDRLRPNALGGEDAEDAQEFVGRIDCVLVHPAFERLEWCAVELQAVYFSGMKMSHEFKMLSEATQESVPFPARHRRPDWRSSGPKRLLPQLQTKVPTIRTWGKKMAVVVDEAFFGSFLGLERERHLSNAEIVWFVVGYEAKPGGWKLVPREAV